MKTTAEKIAVMQAYEDGKTVLTKQYSMIKWSPMSGYKDEPYWNWQVNDYKVKPEPKEIWVTTYPDTKPDMDKSFIHCSYKEAVKNGSDDYGVIRATITHYIEVIED